MGSILEFYTTCKGCFVFVYPLFDFNCVQLWRSLWFFFVDISYIIDLVESFFMFFKVSINQLKYIF